MSLAKINALIGHGEKVAMLTCYDATFAKLSEAAGVDMLLVGDSLGMVLKGAENTLNVSIEDMEYHTKSVKAGSTVCPIMTDMPAGSYEHNKETALVNAKNSSPQVRTSSRLKAVAKWSAPRNILSHKAFQFVHI